MTTGRSAEEAILRAACPALVTREFAQSAHYPHVEETDLFLAWLRREIDARRDVRAALPS